MTKKEQRERLELVKKVEFLIKLDGARALLHIHSLIGDAENRKVMKRLDRYVHRLGLDDDGRLLRPPLGLDIVGTSSDE